MISFNVCMKLRFRAVAPSHCPLGIAKIAPTVSFLIQIIKGTSLAYIIGFQDLMLLGKRWANAPVIGSEPFIIFPIMAVLYFCLCYPLAIYAKHLEKKYVIEN